MKKGWHRTEAIHAICSVQPFTNANDECFYYIFSKAGFTDALLEKQEKGEVRLITLEEMYGKSDAY